eukprot:3802074-Prymnesium_polylepis.1
MTTSRSTRRSSLGGCATSCTTATYPPLRFEPRARTHAVMLERATADGSSGVRTPPVNGAVTLERATAD